MPAPVPAEVVALAAAHRVQQQQIAAAANAATSRLWKFVQTLGWARVAADMTRTVRAALTSAARGAQDYTSAAARGWGEDPDPAGEVLAAAFALSASDGRPLESLLEQPSLEVTDFVDGGMPADQAHEVGRRHLSRIVVTQVADAARVATGVAVTADRKLEGYVRHLTLPSCNRCIILAGQWYRWSDGFARHPQCFPAGVAVSGPEVSAATRRWYQGELVHLATARGEQLSLTGNHPVLTRRGWVPARLLEEGDEVVRSTRTQGASPLVVPDHQQMPARIEDVWGALGVAGLRRVPSAAEDFHGDGQNGEVDVVYADRPLWREVDAALGEQLGEAALAIRDILGATFDLERVPELVDGGHAAHPRGSVRGGGLVLPGLCGHLGGAGLAGGAGIAALHTCLLEAAADDVPAYAVLAAEREFAGARQVGGHNLADREILAASRWDAPGGPLTMENRDAYAGRGRDLLQRLSGQVELDRLVDVRRVEWSGHVYSLTSVEGWHTANSLIVSNCDCVHVPAAVAATPLSPREIYDSLDDEQRRKAGWSGHDQRAIDDGGDLFQVTNYKKALKTVEVAGLRVKTTTVGATKRGLAGKRLGKGQLRYTPEQIYADADRLGLSRDETIRVLKQHGYIL